MNHIYKVILSFVLLTPFCSKSQDYGHYSFNEKYDFEQNTIYSLIEDSRGNIWIGSSEGVHQFNGQTLKHYAPDKYDKSGSNLKEDQFGRIWFSNFSGQLFCIANGRLNIILKENEENSFIQDYFITDSLHLIYMTSGSSAIYQLRLEDKSTTVIYETDNFKILNAYATNNNHTIGLLTVANNENGNATKRIDDYQLDLNSKSLHSKHTSFKNSSKEKVAMTHHSKGPFLFFLMDKMVIKGSNNELFGALNEIDELNFNSAQIMDDLLIVHTKIGMYEIALNSIKENQSFIAKKRFGQWSTSTVLKDREDNLWLGTLDNGIQIIPNTKIEQKQFSALPLSDAIKINDTCIYYLTNNQQLYRSFFPYTRSELMVEKVQGALGMKYNHLSNDLYFINTHNAYNVKNEKLHRLSSKFISKNILALSPKIEVHTYYHKAFLSAPFKATLYKSEIPVKIEQQEKLQSNRLDLRMARSYFIAQDANSDNFYIDYIDGLYYYSETNVPTEVRHKSEPILCAAVQTDSLNGIWIATKDYKLLKIEQGKVVYAVPIPFQPQRISLWKEYCFLWKKGKLLKINTEDNSRNFIDETDGLFKEDVMEMFVYNNTVFLFGQNHLQLLDCRYAYLNEIPPLLRLTSITTGNEVVNHKQAIQLKYNQNDLKFSFNCISTRSQKQYTIKYRLLPATTNWVTTQGNSSEIQFYQLPPGDYTLEIKACNEDGTCSEPLVHHFSIHPHFTGTLWFWVLISLPLISIAVLIIRRRIRMLREKNRLQIEQEQLRKDLYKSKITAIRSQMNPHFMFNALNTIQQYIVTNQKDIASEYLADFADLMRMYLEQSKKDEISLEAELETLKIYLSLESLRLNDQLDYQIECADSIDTYAIQIPVMLIQPFVENSIKHGLLHKKGAKRLSIKFEQNENKTITCTIEDNGIGREVSHHINEKKVIKHNSFATTAIHERIDLINKNLSKNIHIEIIDLKDGETPLGTKVIITLN